MPKCKKLLGYQILEGTSLCAERRQIYAIILIEIVDLYPIIAFECLFFGVLIAGQGIGIRLSTSKEQPEDKSANLDN